MINMDTLTADLGEHARPLRRFADNLGNVPERGDRPERFDYRGRRSPVAAWANWVRDAAAAVENARDAAGALEVETDDIVAELPDVTPPAAAIGASADARRRYTEPAAWDAVVVDGELPDDGDDS